MWDSSLALKDEDVSCLTERLSWAERRIVPRG